MVNFSIITLDHLEKKKKNHAIIGNFGHCNIEIDMSGLEAWNVTGLCSVTRPN